MSSYDTDVAQSFRLRFWRESRGASDSGWRGAVWHEQFERNDQAIMVDSPEDAFDFVRAELGKRGNAKTRPMSAGCRLPYFNRLRLFWHRIRGGSK